MCSQKLNSVTVSRKSFEKVDVHQAYLRVATCLRQHFRKVQWSTCQQIDRARRRSKRQLEGVRTIDRSNDGAVRKHLFHSRIRHRNVCLLFVGAVKTPAAMM